MIGAKKAARPLAALAAITALAALLASATPEARAYFGDEGFVCEKAGEGDSSEHHIWMEGSYWRQSGIAAPGGVRRLELDLAFDDNCLSSPMEMDVLVNGDPVGTLIIEPGQEGWSGGFGFKRRADGVYEVELRVARTVPEGNGSVSLLADGESSRLLLRDGRN